MGTYESLLRPILFRMDAERAHHLGLWCIARGLVRARLVDDPRLRVRVAGIDFPNPIGLAAGFDKNGVALNHWRGLGFGFFEAGTLTPVAQPGNERPRMFRRPEDKAILNRLGFNNEGVEAFRVRALKARPGIPFGVNIGANKSTPTETAHEDYAKAFSVVQDLGDYVAVNVSSPNTPGLRLLQGRQHLEDILQGILAIRRDKSIFVKIAPDLDAGDLDEIVETCVQSGVAGIIATNTTIRRDGLSRPFEGAGGLSGKPLQGLADDALARVSAHAKGQLAIIGVGGIFEASDAIRKIRLGADLVQLYSGWVYGGPATVPRMLLDLLAALDARGLGHVSDLRQAQ